MSARFCDVCRQSFEQEGNEGVCAMCSHVASQARRTASLPPYRTPAAPGQAQGVTPLEIALEGVREAARSRSLGATMEELQAAGILRIANVLEEWRARGFK